MSGFDPVIALQSIAALAAGLALGLFHFHSLRRVTADYLEGNWKRAMAMQFARLASCHGHCGLPVIGHWRNRCPRSTG